jgi:hypothetical protein
MERSIRMIVRDLPNGTALVITQEGHADVAAQLAAHWGNQQFSRIEPYRSMMFGTTYHDSGHREMEADLPINTEKGVPFMFRGAPPGLRKREDDVANALWVRSRDPYASLVVAVHHSGLRKRRYDTVRVKKDESVNGASPNETPLGLDAAFEDLEGWQQEVAQELGMSDPSTRDAFWHNYRLLQVFDLLSLHFCCDGYRGDQLQELTLENVPVSNASPELVELHIVPVDHNVVRVTPYPFDESPLRVSVLARCVTPKVAASADIGQEEYYHAPRELVTWEFTK